MYYGWKIVIALFIVLTFCSGLGFYNHAVTLQALVNEKQLSVELASTAVSIFFLSSGVVGMVIASLLDKHDVRLVITGGALLAAVALVSIRFITSDWQILLAYSLFGVGFAASGLLSATTLITRWFAKKRALALSIASTGLSVGGIVITPGSALLIEAIGIDGSVVIFALLYLVGVIPLTWMLLVSWPADIGLTQDGGKLNPEITFEPTGTSFTDAVKQTYFWAISIAYVFIMLAQVGALAHQYGLVAEHLSGEQAALALGVIPITSIIGRLVGGVLLTHFSARPFTLGMMLLQTGSLLMLSQTTDLIGFIAGLALFGVSVGNLLMLQPLLIAETYGQKAYGRIYGLSNMLTTFGIALGPLILGLIYAEKGFYSASYLAASLAGLAGFVVYRFMARRKPTLNQDF